MIENPNSKAARAAEIGCQRPKITTARAINPNPPDISLPKAPALPIVNAAPPRPAMAPPSVTHQNLVLATFTPTVSAASGCSPTALARNPRRVLKRMNHKTGTITSAKNTVIRFSKRIGPITGMSLSTGILMISKVPGKFTFSPSSVSHCW